MPALRRLLALLLAMHGRPRREQVRELYAPFESNMKAVSSDVYLHEMPGGQVSRPRARRCPRSSSSCARRGRTGFPCGGAAALRPLARTGVGAHARVGRMLSSARRSFATKRVVLLLPCRGDVVWRCAVHQPQVPGVVAGPGQGVGPRVQSM